MNKSIIAIFTGLLVLTPFAAQAGPIQNRINHQEQRVYTGVKNGSISPKEYRQIDRRIDRIEAARIRNIRSGGKLTQSEKNRLNRRLNNTSRTIYNYKHN
jgi:hypothetical protein